MSTDPTDPVHVTGPAASTDPVDVTGQAALEIYRQVCEDYREIDRVFWRVPVLAMSLTGALGFAVATFSMGTELRQALLIFTSACDAVSIVILIRLRVFIMQRMLKKKCSFEGSSPAPRSYVVLAVFVIVLGAASAYGIYAASQPQLFSPASPSTPPPVFVG